MERERQGRHFSIIVIGEGAKPRGGRKIYYKTQKGLSRLGGIGNELADQLAKHIKNEIRVVTLGHVQRGGSPTNVDRILGMRFGHAACGLIKKRKFGHMVALRGQDIIEVSLDDAIGVQKSISPEHPLVKMAEDIGTNFGV